MMERSRIDLRTKILTSIIIGIYVCINVFLLYFHEPWRDEAQAWLIARDVPFLSIPGYMSYEGHPCLWHLIIACFAKLNMPYFTLNIVSLIIMIISVGIMVFYSKVSFYLKVLLIFSPVLTYYYPVIARNYCLIPLCLFFCALFFKGRKEHPARYTLAIGFLIQTNVIMIFTAFLMCVCFLAEVVSDYIHKKRKMDLDMIKCGSALMLPIISVILLGCQMLDLEKNSEFEMKLLGVGDLLIAVGFKLRDIFRTLCGKNFLALAVVMVLLLAFLWVTCIYSRSREKWTVLVVVAGTIVGQSFFYVVFYDFSLQRILVMPLMIIWGIIVLREYFKDISIRVLEVVFGVCICIVLIHHVPAIWQDVKMPYSGSREASEFIRENIPEDAILIGDNKPECSAIVPYLKQKSYLYASNGEKSSYTKWTNGWDDEIEYDQFVSWINAMDVGDKEVWLISSCNNSYIVGVEQISNDYLICFESVKPSIQEEDYRIYRLR